MYQGQQAFRRGYLLLQVAHGIRFCQDAIPLPGRLVVEQPVAEVAQRLGQVAGLSENGSRLRDRPGATQYRGRCLGQITRGP